MKSKPRKRIVTVNDKFQKGYKADGSNGIADIIWVEDCRKKMRVRSGDGRR